MAGKVVLITGASRGIGAAVARKLASEGDTLALVGLEPDELKKVAEDCGPDAGWWEADVTDLESLRTAVEAIAERYGRIDVVMANAGIAAPGFTRSMDPAVWERVLDVDLYGVWRTVHLTLPHLLKSKGYLLLVSSLAAVVHIPGLASYNVAKAGVEAMGNTLRAELRHLGVTVGVAHMTFVDTDMVRGVDEHPVFGKVRTGIPLASRVYPLDFAVDKFTTGINKRSRVIHVPGWIGPMKIFRALIPHLVELGARFNVPKADRAALADIEARGAAESSRASGAGGKADAEKAHPPMTEAPQNGEARQKDKARQNDEPRQDKERQKERRYDVVLLGATGFTGALTAEYLAKNAPPELKWALAGRNKAKLETVREKLGIDLDLVIADVNDPESLRALAESTRIVVTTVGPYIRYGEPLVAACAEAGTDYLDLTGESEFVDKMYVAHHQKAIETGARIIHCCGFDSIPYDLGVQFTVEQLPLNVPLQVEGLIRAGGTPSSGTFHTAITAFSRGKQNLDAHRARRKAQPRPAGRSVKLTTGRIHRAQGFWAVPLPTVDPQIVAYSANLLDNYGPDFRYSHYAAVKHLPVVAGGIAGLGLLAAAAQIPPARNALLSRFKAGDGPSPERRAKSWFKARFIGSGGGKRVTTEVSGGDPGYDETAKMLGECALSLAFDDLPATSGQTTTAAALGPALRDRLIKAGIKFRVVSTEDY